MKDAVKYVCAGVVGTLLIGLAIALIAMLPVIPAVFAGVAMCALSLLPGALVVYGLVYLYKNKKKD